MHCVLCVDVLCCGVLLLLLLLLLLCRAHPVTPYYLETALELTGLEIDGMLCCHV